MRSISKKDLHEFINKLFEDKKDYEIVGSIFTVGVFEDDEKITNQVIMLNRCDGGIY
jgi:regulator of RNase E activity RraA